MLKQSRKKICTKCDTLFDPSKVATKWDEKGFGYSTKLAICPNCGSYVVIKVEEDSSLDVNNDPRFYKY